MNTYINIHCLFRDANGTLALNKKKKVYAGASGIAACFAAVQIASSKVQDVLLKSFLGVGSSNLLWQ